MVFKHHLILLSWLLARSKEQEECTSKAQHAHFPRSNPAPFFIIHTCIKKFCTRAKDLCETEGRAATLQPAARSPPRSPRCLSGFDAHTAGGTVCAHLFHTLFSPRCSDAAREQKQFCKSTEVLLSFCSTYHALWGEHALHIHFWVCQAAQLW